MANRQRAIIRPMSPALRRSPLSALALTGAHLTPAQFYDVVHKKRPVILSPKAARAMRAAYNVIRPGPDSTRSRVWSDHRVREIGRPANLSLGYRPTATQSCAKPFGRRRGSVDGGGDTRPLVVGRANVLARGHSGVRPLVVEHLLALLNRNVSTARAVPRIRRGQR